MLVIFPSPAISNYNSEIDCLAKNIYYEAGGEPYKGKLAVALVTLNRVDSTKYPNTICQVVFQKGQFSWVKNYKKSTKWHSMRALALKAYNNRDSMGVFKATHFHNLRVSPGWKLKKVAKIGSHIFYM